MVFLNQEAEMESAKRKTRSIKKKLSLIDNEPKPPVGIDIAQQNHHIAASAYYKAQARGFVPGHELEDWLAAEAEISQ
jgi:DUF2934 family protein